uniref:NADH dehydrogenase subunit 2 n=1 Tax=Ophiothrix exigua TaxID=1815227 RepID=UPI00286C193F|nr:NADH dehydrogenase subunit 2 [Ophiothrix exigua]WKW95566.1 NADH dehydrogenase subunit 2 [Ophiothrix exigua]
MLSSFLVNLVLGVGVGFIFFSVNWVFIWIVIECITLCLLLLIRSGSSNNRNLEAVSKYFLIQAIASFLLIFGVVFRLYWENNISLIGAYNYVSYLLILFGLLIKLGSFPNPYWFVDVVNGVEYSRLVYILVVSKIGPLYLLFSLLNNNVFFLTGVIGVVTAMLASMLGVNQSNFRKIISFSSVANLGWFVLCIPVMDGWLLLFCFIGYSLTVVPALWMASVFNFSSLGKSNRMLFSLSEKIILVVCLLSLGGLPPFVGFFVKWAFFQSLINSGLYFCSFLLILSSLLSLFFYLYSSFSVFSLSAVGLKGHNIIVSSSNSGVVAYLTSGALVLFSLVFVFLGLIW